jgi:hypothetical protein
MAPHPVVDGIGRGFNDSKDQKYDEDNVSNCATAV